jgi:RNA polymerase sigma-70 factor (ECF subfamily)
MMSEQEHKDIFEQWLHQHQALLFKVVRAYALQKADQEDLFQEVCLQVWRSVPGFKGASAVTTWLYRIALHTAITWKKKIRRREEFSILYEREIPQYETSPQKNEQLEWLFAEITRLDKIDRSLALLLLDGFSYKEMAEILGISESNVGVKIYRIKQQLTKRAEKHHAHGF